MRMILKTAAVAALMTLGACNSADTAAENKADAIREDGENVADTLDEAEDNATTANAADAIENKADAVRAEGENKADAIEDAADKK